VKTKTKAKKVNVRGGSNDPNRGKWCTPKPVAIAVGPFDLDPFSNPHSHIVSTHRCMLEDGGDGFGSGEPGSYRTGKVFGHADASNTVWIQPPYEIVMRALKHYEHTRFTALLRFDPRTTWFRRLYRASALVAVFRGIEFEPPPGIETGGGNSFPHALFYRDARDVTEAVLRLTYAWRTGNGT